MYFNFLPEGLLPRLAAIPKELSRANPLHSSTDPHATQITVLKSLDHPLNKRFFVGEDGQVQKENFQHAKFYDVLLAPVGSIDDLAQLVDRLSQSNRYILIRGCPTAGRKNVQRTGENFAEPAEGSPWAMLDLDDIPVPAGVDPLSQEAIEWAIAKLPVEFHGASYFYQHSGSAGILHQDGTPMKAGLNVHLFFWLNRPVRGELLAAYLGQHCMESGFYRLGLNRGGMPALTVGVDPAPLRTAVQPHFIAAPTIDAGVVCRLAPEARQGLVRKAQDSVAVLSLTSDIKSAAKRLQDRLLDDYKREHGCRTKTLITRVGGKLATTRYSVPPGQVQVRGGRELVSTKLSADEKFLTLYFSDEGSPGSWYVCKNWPQLGIHYGGARMPLKELSEGAYRSVRDELNWFAEVPHHDLELVDEFLPPLSSFAKAKMSLVLSPTGSGKTTAAIGWIQEQVAQRRLVLYAAPTIALVNQMRDDLARAGLQPSYYRDVSGVTLPHVGVIVTTNDSLPRLLKAVYDEAIPHVLIFDEIHQGLDRFMTSSRALQGFEGALSKASQSLLLTGTLTDVQRQALIEEAKQALGGLTEENYCCYEFVSVKRNPLEVVPTERFDSDLAGLLGDFQSKLEKGEPLPRFVLLIDTSKMEMYRRLIESFGLADQAMIVSRQENLGEEIEAARVSCLPMLIASPVFGIGLNFDREPDILWTRFDHVQADTNQISQTVNRANRGPATPETTPCQVRIYGNVRRNAEFWIPKQARLRMEVAERLQGETSIAGLLEEHLHLDRVTYRMLRDAERNSEVALSVLVRDNAIQNFDIVEVEPVDIDKDQAAVTRQARKDGRERYRQATVAASAPYAKYQSIQAMIGLERLQKEQRENWKSQEPRPEREMETQRTGLLVGWLGVQPGEAQKVNIMKVQRLFGERLPWASGQYDAERCTEWAKVAAEKTEKIVVLLEKLLALKAGEISAEDLSAFLTRNGQLGEAFLALVGSDVEFQNVSKEFATLKKARDEARTKGGRAQRKTVHDQGLEALRELLEPLGVTYGKKESRGRQVTDSTKPIVPERWDLPEMILTLKRQAARFRALPVAQRAPMVTFQEPVLEPLPAAVPRQVCEGCVFFHQNDCSVGRRMDWQSPSADQGVMCRAFKGIKIELRMELGAAHEF